MPRRGSSASLSIREQLELYTARVEQLWRTRLLQNGLSPSFSMKWDYVQGLRFESSVIDEDDLRSFLLTFRQFISNDEPVFLFRVYNLCYQHFTSDELKEYLVKSRETWQQELQRGGIRLNYNGHNLSPEEITRIWINGFYFHNDPEMRRMLESLLPHENMLVRHIFLDHVTEATKRVIYVARLIIIALREGSVNA